jgi:hypothetical protein
MGGFLGKMDVQGAIILLRSRYPKEMEKIQKILAANGLTTGGVINVGCDHAVRKVIIAHIPEAKQYFGSHRDSGRWNP